uniref:Cytochrome c oxidase subunit 3 n=1 Tax=Meretrix lyrata TaxID=223151 RepID=V5JV95_9BIVA|nr:cytochrome c oxidase subunit III [Meretrix lyrata]AGR50836.1 cytochrome c oxidase subunit III [Meretrix lyrata]
MGRPGFQFLGPGPWPFAAATSFLGLCATFFFFVCSGPIWVFWISFFFSFGLGVFIMSNWGSDVVKESTFLGQWSSYFFRVYAWGFRFFIFFEVFFFAGLIGSFVYCAVGESSIHGVGFWPPRGIKPLNPGKMALLNTAILIGSSFTANWAFWCVKCHNLLNFNMGVPLWELTGGKKPASDKLSESVDTFYYQSRGLLALEITIFLGVCFTILQAMEYYWASYSFADGVFGSTFFLLTGFHGLHVIIGTIFLIVCWFRLLYFHFSFNHFYFGMWAAVWYWHFVDAVWVVVYSLVYIWGYWGYV